MPENICIDTNIAINFLNGDEKLIYFLKGCKCIILPITVIGELRYGAYKSARPSENLVKVDALEMRCEVIPVDVEIADSYGVIKASLKKKGTPLPENDIWIAACCLSIDIPLLTYDKHFQVVPGLQKILLK